MGPAGVGKSLALARSSGFLEGTSPRMLSSPRIHRRKTRPLMSSRSRLHRKSFLFTRRPASKLLVKRLFFVVHQDQDWVPFHEVPTATKDYRKAYNSRSKVHQAASVPVKLRLYKATGRGARSLAGRWASVQPHPYSDASTYNSSGRPVTCQLIAASKSGQWRAAVSVIASLSALNDSCAAVSFAHVLNRVPFFAYG